MTDLWELLSDPANRTILTWLGSGLVAIAGGIWTVVKFFRAKDEGRSGGPSKPRLRPESGGVVGGRDVRIQKSHGVSGGQLIVLITVVVGAVLLAAGLFGDRIVATHGVAVGGDVKNSTITIDEERKSGKP